MSVNRLNMTTDQALIVILAIWAAMSQLKGTLARIDQIFYHTALVLVNDLPRTVTLVRILNEAANILNNANIKTSLVLMDESRAGVTAPWMEPGAADLR